MFTGIVQQIGTIKRVSRGQGLTIEVEFAPWPKPLENGESIAVNGVCLTVAKFNETRFTADVLSETENRTTFKSMIPGAKVNLERALCAGEPLGGHLVQGHVDTVGEIVAKTPKGRDFQLKVQSGRVLAAELVIKGSIAIDGVSLTITGLGEDHFTVDLIPTTLKDTTLGLKKLGDKVNLESDIIGKYIKRQASGLTEEKLAAAGFI